MVLVIVGVLLLAAKLAEFGPTAGWSWWIVAAPFVGAVLWWQFADATGLTQRRAMQKMEDRKAQRRDRALEALGLDPHHKKQVKRAREETRAGRAETPSTPPPPPPDPHPPRRDPRL
ncbi:MAG TPA: TIGR04438 family Trp-rich protein [Rubrivivax sp.]|nr:TIGR04438 family Trp-rich protein [Rubrivivax sp.]